MPGLFGGIGLDGSVCAALEQQFVSVWRDSEVQHQGEVVIGGHAFLPHRALFALSDGAWIGVDGEYDLYHETLTCGAGTLFGLTGQGFELTTSKVGNVAYVNPRTGYLHLAADWSGSIPLYYTQLGDGFLFSSLLRPLARAVGAPVDDVGLVELVTQAYTFCGRTPFLGIRRLLPGQVVSFCQGTMRVQERSLAWSILDDECDTAAAASYAWSKLQSSMNSTSHTATALMMSAGWDSRSLFGVARADRAQGRTVCYSHGDLASREIRIVERICRDSGIPLFLEPVDDRVWDISHLEEGFARVETVVFPHWLRAGGVLCHAGIDCAVAGVYGEVLGGHYGPAMLLGGRKKMMAVANSLLGRAGDSTWNDIAKTRQFLRTPRVGRPWYLSEDYARDVLERKEEIRADAEEAVSRLEARGIPSAAQLIEAFVAEHRGSQYINAQLLSCRAHVDVSLPFANRDLFYYASTLPLVEKIHNKVNRTMLSMRAPDLLRFPLAATLARADRPLPFQEMSRLVRSVYESGRSRLHESSRGRISAPRLGWVNFGFLQNGAALESLIESLEGDVWNRQALQDRLIGIRSGKNASELHPVYDQLSKILSVDLLLRA